MKLVVLNESVENEWCEKVDKRCAITPATVKKLVRSDIDVHFQGGAGLAAGYDDDAFIEAGAHCFTHIEAALGEADVLLMVNQPSERTVKALLQGATVIGHLDPFFRQSQVESLASANITAVSVEMIPRSSRAQKMDALSSQASLAGYVMVMQAANQYGSILPMMMTPSGTIKPAKVFVIGAGVAGLQAIATAKRLGASVTAYDTRDVVAEQVESLGAKFLHIDLGETGQTKDGYANELTDEQRQRQQAGQRAAIVDSDIVITTAQLFGRKPPRLISRDVLADMRSGSVVVDMAAQNGGNVEGSEAGKTILIEGVSVIGTGDWPSQVATAATNMYANNLLNFIEEFYDAETARLKVDFDDDITRGCVITHQGEISNDMLRKAYQG